MGTRGHCGWVPPSQPTGPPASTCSLPGPVLSLRPGPSEVTSQQQEESPSCLPRGADSALRGPVPGLDPGAGSPRGHQDQARVPCLGGIPRGSWWQMTQNAPRFPPSSGSVPPRSTLEPFAVMGGSRAVFSKSLWVASASSGANERQLARGHRLRDTYKHAKKHNDIGHSLVSEGCKAKGKQPERLPAPGS